MYDYLVEHAINHVWCAPRMDRQCILRPAKISQFGGALNTVPVLWRIHRLPQPGVRFHVYQVGQLNPLLLNLFPEQYRWINLATACNKQKLVADVYSQSGLQFPRFETWYMVTADKNLIIAVKEQERMAVDLNHDDLYMRVYTNAYFNTNRLNKANDLINIVGDRPLNVQSILNIQNKFEISSALPGVTYGFVNGYKVSKIDLTTVQLGDVVEFVYDSTIKHVIDFRIGDLRTFDSLMDLKRKYLLHYAGTGDDTIDYQDDIDFFLMQPQVGGRYKGVYYHRNEDDSVRMVTHKDYSVPTGRIEGFASYQPGWGDRESLVLRMHVRHGGWERSVVFENNRIKELYKLGDNDLRDAMLGVNSSVNNWRGDVLEASPYTKIMRSEYMDITRELVQDAYGYNAISKLIADTPKFVRLESNQKVVDVPYGLQNSSTGFEYDAAGLLIDWHTHLAGTLYPARNDNARLIEMIAGTADDRLDEVYGDREVIIDLTASHRMYLCDIVAGFPTNKWRDVTGSGAYVILGDKLTWLVDLTRVFPMVRSDRVALTYKINLTAVDGLLRFSLNHRVLRDGNVHAQVMQVPMGELDLFLNKRTLIEGLDYYVNFPEIVIVNKEYLINVMNQTQEITVRFTGFCKPDFSRYRTEDVGFVKYGLLSRNNRFDLRDDKVLRITVGGCLYDRSELKFSETDSGVSVPDVGNGVPYMVRDIIVPLREVSSEDTYEMRAKSMVIDKAVSAYMSAKIPEPVMPGPPVIPKRYQVFSPFCCKLLYDLKNGWLTDPRMYEQYSDIVLMELCKPYEFLLKSDPTQEPLVPDDNFVIVHPHNLFTVIDLNIYLYRFLSRAVAIYLNNRVELSHFIRIVN